ncbi:MAG TPA: hypothetical protein PKH24_16515 [Sedimentisphaerales bacterium]|nr:hypothetical protein [Sedimentisphaerales bacterium]HNU30109.1 hypothetical protein [Sedimentisphaerales bacterium]
MLESRGAYGRTRAWRRRQRVRMIARAWRFAKERYPHPEGISVVGRWCPWRDIKGQWRLGPVAWDDVFALRDEYAHCYHDNLAVCSLPSCCGNPRPYDGNLTPQERRAEDSARNELAEYFGR